MFKYHVYYFPQVDSEPTDLFGICKADKDIKTG